MADLMAGRTPPRDKLDSFVERAARRMAAKKMGIKDFYGSNLPDDLWMQCLDAALHEHRIAMLQRLRAEIEGIANQGYPIQDWQLAMWARYIDSTKDYESAADRLIRLRHGNAAKMTDDELNELGPESLEREHKRRAQVQREKDCPGHEFESAPEAALFDPRRGWHPGHCKHCGKDMSVDSGD